MKKSFVLILAAALFFIYSAEASTENFQTAMREIFHEADSFKTKKSGAMEYYEAYQNTEMAGYCMNVIARGYGGPICMVVGIDPDGIIKGVRIIAHCETPGIGAKINEIISGEEEPWFLKQFAGKDGRTVKLKQNIDAVSGATISSNGVTSAINGAVNEFMARIKKAPQK